MKIEEIFYILGTAPTKDEAAIKGAYRKKLSTVNPEDDQEGFKRLRKAYEEACSYARNKEEEKEEEDTTPSGLWAGQAVSLYERLSKRCDEEGWKRLFQEEIFISFEGYEECRKKLLIFFMNHFQFPQKIWQVFDKYLNICEDRDHLKEIFPEDFIQFIVQRCEEKEAVDYSLFQGPDDGDYDLFLNCYREGAGALNRQEYGEAEQALEKAEVTGIFHPYMEILRALVYKGSGREEEAGELLLGLLERYPANEAVLLHVSNYYWEKDRKEEAWDCCRKLKELEPGNYMANYRLAFYYYEKEDYRTAEECINMASGVFHEEMKKLLKEIHAKQEPELKKRWAEKQDMDAIMELADNYYKEERYYAAGKILEEIRDRVPAERKEEYLLLLAKDYLGQGENGKAVETVRNWQERAGKNGQENQYAAIRLTISAYHMMGRGIPEYFDKAEKEYEKIKEQSEDDSELLMEMAQIFLEKKEYQKCIDLSEILLDKFRIYFAWVFMLKAYAGLWDGAGVVRCGRRCIEYFPGYAYPYEEMAKVYYDTGHEDEIKRLLDLAEKNKIESCYLDSGLYHGEKPPEGWPIDQKLKEFDESYYDKISMTGNLRYYREGYPVITRYLKMYPCNLLLSRRGLFSMAAKDHKAAMKDFQKILERDLADAFACNYIGCLYKYAGEYEKALVYFKRAVYYMSGEENERSAESYYANLGLAHTYELMGEYRQAAAVYRYLYEKFQGSDAVAKGLAANYARTGRLEAAEQVIREVYAKDPNEKEAQLYRAYLYAGEFKRAFQRIYRWEMMLLLGFYVSMSQERLGDQMEYRLKYRHILAWRLLFKGQWEKSIKALGRALKRPEAGRKDRIDMILNQIFIFTIGEKREEAKGQIGIEKSLEQLKKILQWAQESGKKNGEGDSLVETGDFFYKERYVKYIDFILTLYGQGVKKGEEAWKEMEKSPRCRRCTHASCMRLKIAEALLLERKGEAEKAVKAYRELAEEQPDNLYARAKLIYEEKFIYEEKLV